MRSRTRSASSPTRLTSPFPTAELCRCRHRPLRAWQNLGTPLIDQAFRPSRHPQESGQRGAAVAVGAVSRHGTHPHLRRDGVAVVKNITTYQTGAQVVVCDNTLSAALTTADSRVKVRHSPNSLAKLAQVRDALGIVHQVADDFAAQVEQLTNQTVTDAQWTRFLAAYCGTDDTKASKRALTTRREQSNQLDRLWSQDQRVTPWRVPPTALSRPRTPTRTTSPPSAAPPVPSGTPNAWSPARCTTWTATPSRSSPPSEQTGGTPVRMGWSSADQKPRGAGGCGRDSPRADLATASVADLTSPCRIPTAARPVLQHQPGPRPHFARARPPCPT